MAKSQSKWCRQKRIEYCREWYSKNKEAHKEKRRIKYREFRDLELSQRSEWRKNPENYQKYRKSIDNWKDNNPEKLAEYVNKRRSSFLQACPPWLSTEDKKAISEIYKKCRNLTKKTGITHHVDHIYPLNGKKVCGLHVPSNLQIVTASFNYKKQNKMPEEL